MDLNFVAADFYSDDHPHPVENKCDQMTHRDQGERRLRLRWIIAAGMIMVMTLSVFRVVVRANGAPVDVFLNYIPGTSTWGPSSATGHAVVAIGEGEVRLETKGLPHLKDERYQVWLERADTGELISVGLFNSDESGKGELHVLSDDLPYTQYRAMWITVEPLPDPDPAPSARRALVGRFPNMELAKEALLQPAAGLSVGAPNKGSAESSGPRPEFLPVTGGRLGAWGRVSSLLLLLPVMGGVTIVAWYACRRMIQ
jgi:hypothetical protein